MTRDGVSKEAIFLSLGDLIAYIFSLILTLVFRYHMMPGRALLTIHLQSFWPLFILFLLVNFAVGLYDIRSALRRGWNGGAVLSAQLVNAILGIAYFYLIPADIAPKANLFIFLVISTLALILWRAVMYPTVSAAKKQTAILIGEGVEIEEMAREVNGQNRYGLFFKETIIPRASIEEMKPAISEAVKRTGASIIVADLHNATLESTMPLLYSLVFSGVKFIDASRLYEGIFGRVPLTMVGERWLVENSGSALGNRRMYDILKRAMDIVVAAVLGLVSLVFYPFVWIAVRLDDKGPLFVVQERVGKNGLPIRIVKFRSMTADDSGAYQKNGGKTKLKITRVGRFIRLTRIDELPQLWSVLKGDQSLIGPRPELPPLVNVYEKEIPYYNARHLVKPGISGWAQIYGRHAHHGVGFDETRDKLSYDLFYVKNRSFMLDLKIALQTLRALISRQGV
jgi:exopolysaccharide biosynthesis polyprenyl glycosylphosphotransferase